MNIKKGLYHSLQVQNKQLFHLFQLSVALPDSPPTKFKLAPEVPFNIFELLAPAVLECRHARSSQTYMACLNNDLLNQARCEAAPW